MYVRLLMPDDHFQMRRIAKAASAEVTPDLGFDEDVFGRTFEDVVSTGHPTCFVALDGETIVGFLLCSIEGFFFAAGLSTCVHVIYVTPAKRGSRASALLLADFIRWSDNVGVRRKYLPQRFGVFQRGPARG